MTEEYRADLDGDTWSLTLTGEVWRKVPGFWPYEVSNLGRIKRLTPGSHTQAGRVLVPSNRRGQVRLTQMIRLNGERVQINRQWLVHRLVWSVFVGDPGVKAVKPLNGDLLDARLVNLGLGRRGPRQGIEGAEPL